MATTDVSHKNVEQLKRVNFKRFISSKNRDPKLPFLRENSPFFKETRTRSEPTREKNADGNFRLGLTISYTM